MKNFHYNPQRPKDHHLLQQLQEIDRDLEDKKQQYMAQKKLQEEFYEDNKNMGLADDIMNELLGNKKQPVRPPAQQRINSPMKPRQQYASPVALKKQEPSYFREQEQRPIQHQRQIPRQQNNFVNRRELQKMKLQNRNAIDQYPFGRNESREKPVGRSPVHAPQRDIAPRSLQKGNRRKLQMEEKPQDNPFLKNEVDLAKKREQEQKNYRRLLQEQMEEQKRRKKEEEQQYKKDKNEAFNNYVPPISKENQEKSENPKEQGENQKVKSKKRDPNGGFPVYDNMSNNNQSDLAFMKMQVDDLKKKFKKGRINHEEYESQRRKLELHYSIKIEDLDDEEKKPNQQEKTEKDKIANEQDHGRDDAVSKNLSNAKADYNDFEAQNASNNYRNQRSDHTMQIPDTNLDRRNLPNFSDYPQQNTRIPQDNYSMQYGNNYPQAQMMSQMMGNMMGANPTEMQLQMMMKIFDQFKGIIKLQHESQMDLLNQKKLWHETMSKMSPYFNPQNQNPNMFTQQVPQSQNIQNQKEYFSDVKKFERFDEIPKINRQPTEIVSNPYGDSETSNSYIEKSLSAVVNKIPLTKKQKEKQSGQNHREIEQFYQRKYKVKKFRPFEYTESVKASSTNPMPSVSNYIQSSDSQEELNYLFERDLKNYKKIQKQKQMEMMKKKLNKNSSKPAVGHSQISSISQSQYQHSNVDEKLVKLLKGQPSEVSDESGKKKSPTGERKKSKSPNRNYRKAKEQNKQEATKNKHKKQKSKHKQLEEEELSNPFLKKHISNDSYQPPTFQEKDFRGCDFVNSPQQKSSEILEQQQYQTEPRKYDQEDSDKKSPQKLPPHKPNFAKNKDNASAKILDIMKTNNQLLSKYELTPSKSSLPSIRESVPSQSNRTVESRDYFSSHDISPVQKRQYESSLQTVRSEEQSVRLQRKNNMDILMMGSAERNHQTLLSQYNSPVVTVHQSPSVESIEITTEKKPEESSSKKLEREKYPHVIGYSQTVESIEQSSGKFPSFNRPPIVNNSKKGRSTSRKKQSVVKLGGLENRSLSGITSEGSRQKSSLVKPPEYEGQKVLVNNSSVKFDEKEYQSKYEASVSRRVDEKNTVVNRGDDNYYNFEPKVFVKEDAQHQNKESDFWDKEEAHKQKRQKTQEEEFRKIDEINSEIQKKSQQQEVRQISAGPAHKWKSLEEARKIAKEFRQRAGEDHNRSSVQEKLSELESFINTSKKDESINRGSRQSSQIVQTPQTKKKDILKMLDDLGQDEDYEADFDSYKEESER